MRDQSAPRMPTMNAPLNDTKSEQLWMSMFATLFRVYAMHKMTTVTSMSHDQNACRFASEDSTEKTGTMNSCVHHGNKRWYQGKSGLR